MSDSTIPIGDNNCVIVQSGKRDDVKYIAQTHSAENPSGGETKNADENKGGNKNNIGWSDDVRYRRRRKTRRGKSKRRKLKPYSKLTWQERKEEEDNRTKRANKVRSQMFGHAQPVAPYNTNQFLMDDHNDVQDLDVQLKAVTTNSDRIRSNSSVFQRPTRVRDSSVSVDSEDDYFYSSPEDEEEFLTKEFSNAYEDLHAERLHQMPKSQLIQEYLQLEEKIDSLQKRLQKSETVQSDDVDMKGEMQIDEESSPKVQLFQQEINRLLKENEQLRRENEHLRESCKQRDSVSSVSSVDSESDSTCSSASDSSDSSDGETGSESKESIVRTCDTNNAQLE